MKIIGIDLDGVLADFLEPYRQLLFQVSGRELIAKGFEPPCWDWEPVYGYTRQDIDAAWKKIDESPDFWLNMDVLPGAVELLYDLHHYDLEPKEVYYITKRTSGIDVKGQSEKWLKEYGHDPNPTVLMTRGDKGQLAKGLGLTHFVDDKPENCFLVKEAVPSAEVYMMSARMNGWADIKCSNKGIRIIKNLHQLEDIYV